MNNQRHKSNKYIFTLRVNVEKVDQKYGIVGIVSNITSEDVPPTNITNISELNVDRSTTDIVSFFDESKKLHKCCISMIDFRSQTDVSTFRSNCFWDRNPFDSKPLGCPIRYVTSQAVKVYHSEISKDVYTIKENITSSRKNKIQDPRVNINVREYYETDGAFCSFNCMKAFILDNKHNRLYDNSLSLLLKMYNKMMGTKINTIDTAPHWRILKEYGGQTPVSLFRLGFNKVEYDSHGTIQNFPEFRPIGFLYEERFKF